ncbi:hypothetical protein GH153_00930 [bacterium]|nr:hypothetical protein [bacterium]
MPDLCLQEIQATKQGKYIVKGKNLNSTEANLINYRKKRGEKMSEDQKVVSQFNKNSIEIVKVITQEWKGKEYIDLRIWIMQNPADPGSEKPTQKGLTLDIELLPKLIDALKKAQEALNEGSRTHKKKE